MAKTQQQRWDERFGYGSWNALADPVKQSEFERVFGKPKPSAKAPSTKAPARNTGYGISNNTYGAEANAKADILKNRFDTANQLAQQAYDFSAQQTNTQTDDALAQAYRTKLFAEKNMPQQLAATGISGGGAESTYTGLANNYANNRNRLETQRQTNLSKLLAQLSEAKQKNLKAFEEGFYGV